MSPEGEDVKAARGPGLLLNELEDTDTGERIEVPVDDISQEPSSVAAAAEEDAA